MRSFNEPFRNPFISLVEQTREHCLIEQNYRLREKVRKREQVIAILVCFIFSLAIALVWALVGG